MIAITHSLQVSLYVIKWFNCLVYCSCQYLDQYVQYKPAYSIIWPDEAETKNDLSSVAVLHEADVSRIATDVELLNNGRDEVSHPTPRVTVDVVDAAWRVHHERQVHRRATDWIINALSSQIAVLLSARTNALHTTKQCNVMRWRHVDASWNREWNFDQMTVRVHEVFSHDTQHEHTVRCITHIYESVNYCAT